MSNWLADERTLAAYLAGVHMTLLRRGHRTFPAAVLSDLRAAVLRAAPCELRSELLVTLEPDDVPIITAGQHLEAALDRLPETRPAPTRGYR